MNDCCSNATDQQKIGLQAFINRSKNAGFCNTELDDFALLCAKADKDLFTKVPNSPDHVLNPLLPPAVQQNYNLRNKTPQPTTPRTFISFSRLQFYYSHALS